MAGLVDATQQPQQGGLATAAGAFEEQRLAGIQAVQTLSRLNRTTRGKTDTFVLDFVNEPDEIYAALREADLFVSIGTSGAVYPAAGFVRDARELGARTLELNLERSQGSAWFDETRLGPASEVVPAWVEEVLKG